MSINFKGIIIIICLFFYSFSLISKEKKINLNKYEKTPRSIDQVKIIVGKIKRKELFFTLADFVKNSRPNRFIGSGGHAASIRYIVETIRKNKNENDLLFVDEFKPDIKYATKLYNDDFENTIVGRYPPSSIQYKSSYRFKQSIIGKIKNLKHVSGRNIVYEKTGTKRPNDILLLGAHLDTIILNNNTSTVEKSGNMPGADNNATGVSTLLNLIKIIGQMNFEKTVRIVFFDFETLGFLGSRAFVDKYYDELINKGKNTVGFVNLLMLGHDTKKFDNQHKFGNMKLYVREKNNIANTYDQKLANIMTANSRKKVPGITFNIFPYNFSMGSNISFWERDIPAIAMTGDWENDSNSRIHTAMDLPETLNLNTLYKAYQHIALAVITWAFDINK